jgi:hypothetical protein
MFYTIKETGSGTVVQIAKHLDRNYATVLNSVHRVH